MSEIEGWYAETERRFKLLAQAMAQLKIAIETQKCNQLQQRQSEEKRKSDEFVKAYYGNRR